MGARELDFRSSRRARCVALVVAVASHATLAFAQQNRAAFPTEPSSPSTPPPQPPPPQYPPQQPAPAPPQQYPPQQYPPQQYPPQQYRGAPTQGFPAPSYAPQAPSPYPSPYAPVAPQPPPEPQNPLVGPDMRYRQVLGTYQRPMMAPGPAADAQAASHEFVTLRDRRKRRHDGFYFRFGLGIGRGHDSMSTATAIPTDRQLTFEPVPFDGSGTATSPVTELAFGYAFGAGVTLGAGAYTATLPKFSVDVQDPNTGKYEFLVSQLALIGPVVDWYFDEEGGFHAEASPGVSTYVAGAGEPKIAGPQAQAHTAVGFGFMLGVGYDWWVADQWSIGILGRFQYGTMDGSAPAPGNTSVDWHHTAYAPAVLVTTTYQ